MRSGLGRTILIWLLVAVVATVSLVFLVRPAVPAGAAQAPVARTALTGPISPDVGTGDDPVIPDASPTGQACLPRIERDAGWADVCWAAYRLAADADASKDYYLLRMYGSFQSTSALGVRWLVVEARLDGEPGDNVFDGWPDGTIEGPCRSLEAHLLVPLGAASMEEVCGRTTGGLSLEPWGWRSTWTCDPCIPFDSTTRGLGMVNVIGVPQGTIPVWDLYADFGG